MFDTSNTNLHKLISFAQFNEASKPNEGERLIKICYRTDTKTGIKLRESVCLSVPTIDVTSIKDNIDKLLPLFLSSIQEQQDKIARKLYESGNSKSISSSQLSIDAVTVFLEESIHESRLTKEMIDNWFTEIVEDKLSNTILSKYEGTGITEEKLTAILTEYKSKFSALAGGRTNYDLPIATALVKIFDLIPDAEDTLTIRLFTRLSDMIDKTTKSNSLLLDI